MIKAIVDKEAQLGTEKKVITIKTTWQSLNRYLQQQVVLIIAIMLTLVTAIRFKLTTRFQSIMCTLPSKVNVQVSTFRKSLNHSKRNTESNKWVFPLTQQAPIL